MSDPEPAPGRIRARLHSIVFHADDPVGKWFDVALIIAIITSVIVVMMESVDTIHDRLANTLRIAEWVFTILFTAEYLVRLWVVERKRDYALSFFGIVDVLSVLPTYISLFISGAQALLVVRILRVLRIFRVLKLASYIDEAESLGRALAASKRKIFVFMFVVVAIVTIMGSMMYVIEGGENGFTSIPQSVYWAVVTLSTVGYGDLTPMTPLGKFLSTIIIMMGYGIIAVPTGIVTVELGQERARAEAARRLAECPTCGLDEHDADARYCKRCGRGILRTSPGASGGHQASQTAPPSAASISG